MKRIQKIVATGYLSHDERVLLIKRSDAESFLPGYYEMPGGKCDFGEGPAECLRREFKEETGLDIRALKPYRALSYISDDQVIHTIEIVFMTELVGNERVKLGKDHTDYRWLGEEDLGRYLISDEMRSSTLGGFEEYSRLSSRSIDNNVYWKRGQ